MNRSALRSIVHEGRDDPSLTAHAGLLLVGAAGLSERQHPAPRPRDPASGPRPGNVRADSGFYSLELMKACRRHRISFSISVPRSSAMWDHGDQDRILGPKGAFVAVMLFVRS